MNAVITVTVSGAERPTILHGPVPAIVMIKNLSLNPTTILLPYPAPNDLSFACQAADFTQQKVVERQGIERTAPLLIEPGGSHTAVYYLNRYFTFQKPGEGKIAYRLSSLVTALEGTHQSHANVVFTGEFTVRVVAGSEDALQAELARYAQNLQSDDRQVQREAAEALAFLDTPLSVKYVAPMLSIDNLEIIGIEALGRHPSAESFAFIVGMLAHGDSSVVAAALKEIDRHKIAPVRSEVYKLLTSENPNNRWLAVDWLSKSPEKQDLEVVQPLTVDENNAVREQANKYLTVLRRM